MSPTPPPKGGLCSRVPPQTLGKGRGGVAAPLPPPHLGGGFGFFSFLRFFLLLTGSGEEVWGSRGGRSTTDAPPALKFIVPQQ